MTKVIICGSRTYTDWYSFYLKIDPILKDIGLENVEIVSGFALGPDMMAIDYAHINNVKLTIKKADWRQYGKSAGFVRNAEMMRYCLDTPDRRVIAFWKGKSHGTKHMMDIASRNGFNVTVIPVD